MRQDATSNTRDGIQDTGQHRIGYEKDSTTRSSSTQVTVYEAADLLGVTVDAIRKRIQRGTIPHERHDDGRVYVLLDETSTLQDDAANTTSAVRDTNQDNRQVRYRTDELVESLQDQIEFLRRELERKDAIIMSLSQRTPELEAPEPRQVPETPPEGTSEETPDPQEPSQQRSWWRRWFGF